MKKIIRVKLTEENLISKYLSTYIPIILSISALLFSVYQGCQNHLNNKLSKLPHLDFVVKASHPYNSDSQTINCEDPDRLRGILIKNNGIGPAKIKNIQVFWTGQTKKIEFGDIHEFNLFYHSEPRYIDLRDTFYLSAGDELFLYKTTTDNIKEPEAFANLLRNKLDVQLIYCSLFGECWQKCIFNRRCEDKYIGEESAQ